MGRVLAGLVGVVALVGLFLFFTVFAVVGVVALLVFGVRLWWRMRKIGACFDAASRRRRD